MVAAEHVSGAQRPERETPREKAGFTDTLSITPVAKVIQGPYAASPQTPTQ